MQGLNKSYYALVLRRAILKCTPHILHKYFPRIVFTTAFDGIASRVHTMDSMFSAASQRSQNHYVSVGVSALRNIEDTLSICNLNYSAIEKCLDFACGYGRVLRWIQTKINPSRITACDIDKEAVDFCKSEFGVNPLYSAEDPEEINFAENYDLIWVGSLLTHVDAKRFTAFIKVFIEILNPGGVLIFTTQGEGCFTNPGLTVYKKRFKGEEQHLRKSFLKDGYCYIPYKPSGRYGFSIFSKEYVEKIMTENFSGRVTLDRFKERGWDNHQDVWSYRKVPI